MRDGETRLDAAPPGLRIDIQILRAIAVGMVLFFHAELPGLPGGFLGVDVFLVISGYLITGLIARGIAQDHFRISVFFLNRAKRLLPAAYVVYLVTGIAGLWLLTDSEMQRYLDTLVAALTFTANIELWQSTNYFNAAAKQNVLLHTWSLSLEEQFYFIVPFAMVLLPRRFWTPLVALGFAFSIAGCFYLVSRSPVATFYLLPTRAWELLLGAMLALSEPRIRGSLRAGLALLGPVALAVLLAVPVFMPGVWLGFAHPSLDALLVAGATAVLIAGRPAFLNRRDPFSRAAFWIGGISYSLYMVHWPLFAFAHNAYLDAQAPHWVRLALLVVSILLAAGLHAAVERPIHRMRLDCRRAWTAAAMAAATAAVFLVAMALPTLRDPVRDYATLAERNHGLAKGCYAVGTSAQPDACTNGPNPRIMLWGDSFAMHLAHVVSPESGTIVQATLSACGPALGLSQMSLVGEQNAAWARSCIQFNDRVLVYLADHPEIETVIVSSPFRSLLGQNERGVMRDANGFRETDLSFELAVLHFARAMRAAAHGGRRVIIVSPPPSIGVDMFACIERAEMELLTLGPNRDCQLDSDAASAFAASAFDLFDQLAQIPGVQVLDLFDALCTGDTCLLELDGTLLYRDAGHFSIDGARLLGELDFLGLADILAQEGP